MCHSDTGWEVKLGEQGKKYLARTQQECTFKGVVILSFSYRYVLLLLLSPHSIQNSDRDASVTFCHMGMSQNEVPFWAPKM